TIADAGSLVPDHLTPCRMAGIRWPVEELITAADFIEDMLPAEVERGRRRQLDVAGGLAGDQERDLPGTGAGRDAHLVAQHLLASDHDRERDRCQHAGS